MRIYFLVTMCCMALGLAQPASADTVSSIRYEQGSYNDGGDSYYLDIDLGFESQNHLVFGYGKNTSQIESESLASDSFYIGLYTDPYADLSTAVTYTYLEEDYSYDLDSIRIDFIVNTDNWGFSLSPELRSINFYTTTNTTINTLSPALGLTASYYGFDRVYISLGRTVYFYEENVGASSGQTTSGIGNFSVSTLDQAYGLDDYRNRFAAGYNYGAGNIGLRHTRIAAKVDAVVTTINSIYISYKFNDAWLTELSSGIVEDDFDETRFVTAALGYYW
jgi:hypothetical protein